VEVRDLEFELLADLLTPEDTVGEGEVVTVGVGVTPLLGTSQAGPLQPGEQTQDPSPTMVPLPLHTPFTQGSQVSQ